MSEPTSRTQRDIRQSKPFRSTAHEATIALVKTADDVRRHADEFLAPHDLTATQYNVLRILRGAGPEGLATLEVADRLVQRAPGITRLLDRLEVKGLVRRERCPGDRRQVLCFTTPRSARLLESLDQGLSEFDERAMSALSGSEQRTLIGFLDRIRASLDG